MKRVDPQDVERVPGRRIGAGETFRFRCRPGIGCFNRCCRNLNLYLSHLPTNNVQEIKAVTERIQQLRPASR